MAKYIDAEKLRKEIEKRIKSIESCLFIEAEFGAEMRRRGKIQTYNEILSLIDILQQEFEVNEFSFQGGTATINGVEYSFKPGKAKVIILDITENED